MRILIVCLTLVFASLAAAPVVADDLSVVTHNADGTLNWHGSGHVLMLRSDGADGIRVTKAEPNGVFGMHQGDEIVAIDGEPVSRIDVLLERLRGSKPDSVDMLVRRDGVQQTVVVTASAYGNILPPPPPEPPVSSSPPTPPPPPSDG